jgi:hypothetical protein
MANSKISALTSATTPLAGTEVLPVVQSGVTTQVSVANLTVGRAVSASSLSATGAGSFGATITTGTGVSTGGTTIELGGSRTGNGNALIDFHGVASTDYESRTIRFGGVNGAFQIINTGTGDLRLQQINIAPIIFATNNIEVARVTTTGDLLGTSTGGGGIGYGTGSGGTVTQGTSRTTGVTLNKTNGAITMFTAVGSAVAATFTVTNSTVAATDTIILNQKSGTNLYILLVTAVAAGSFNITFLTTGGIASDTPVINFSVIKAVTA